MIQTDNRSIENVSETMFKGGEKHFSWPHNVGFSKRQSIQLQRTAIKIIQLKVQNLCITLKFV